MTPDQRFLKDINICPDDAQEIEHYLHSAQAGVTPAAAERALTTPEDTECEVADLQRRIATDRECMEILEQRLCESDRESIQANKRADDYRIWMVVAIAWASAMTVAAVINRW